MPLFEQVSGVIKDKSYTNSSFCILIARSEGFLNVCGVPDKYYQIKSIGDDISVIVDENNNFIYIGTEIYM